MSNQKESIMKEAFEFLKMLLISFVIVYSVTLFVFKPIRVNGDSMYPTLEDNQVGITFLFNRKDVQRFDIVVVYVEEVDKNLVKRVIGMPGDTICYRNNLLYVNGLQVDETFLNQDYIDEVNIQGIFTMDIDEFTLEEDEYYLLGDNRLYSKDSRAYGPFSFDEIVGRGVFVLFPFSQFGSK